MRVLRVDKNKGYKFMKKKLPLLIFALTFFGGTITFIFAFDEEVTKKSWVVRGSDYIESVFYLENQEIAREKISVNGIYDETGEIPNGKVTFSDENNKTYGEEYYQNGKKDGEAKIFYENGQLKTDSYYKDGVLLTSKEYYHDGRLRFEGDYTDARDSKDYKETGVGKIYFKDGPLKYEWNFTQTEKKAFRKAYNSNGELVYAAYYDVDGKLIEEHKGGQEHASAESGQK